MQGDFSRLTFDPKKHYRSVRMQQGRVQLDADWNEQIDIFNYYMETQLKDILGPGGAPVAMAGFNITTVEISDEATQLLLTVPQADQHQQGQKEQKERLPNFSISRGRYYVEGILCENEQDVLFSSQPYYPHADAAFKEQYLVYLDVWQRHVTAFEDASLREIALGGTDTTTRVQTIWQVKLLPIIHERSRNVFGRHTTYEEVMGLSEWKELVRRSHKHGMLAARHVPNSSVLDNQLYRVEIHQIHEGKVTFKWSRENGSIVFDVAQILSYAKEEHDTARCTITLKDMGHDLTQLQRGDWVEFVSDESVLHGYTLPLYQVMDVSDASRSEVTLCGQYTQILENMAQRHTGQTETLLIRRWDHSPANDSVSGMYPVKANSWVELERGIQVNFSANDAYTVGDYWLIPTRTLLNDVEWAVDQNGPLQLLPAGIRHHYCPLALLHLHQQHWTVVKDVRRLFAPLPTITERTHQMRRPEEVKTEIIEDVQVIERNVLYEECTSDTALGLGDVVSLVPSTNLQVTKASKENAKLVFGVISGDSEVGGQKRYRVTTYGRAQCKVVEAVEAGDLLTVAEEEGYATKTGSVREFFHAGSLVGKALASYTPPVDTEADDILPRSISAEDKRVYGLVAIMVTLQ